MNNEPVAWMKSNGEVSVTNGEAFCIPLYTHTVKELTDEEIMQIVEESYMPQGMDKSRYTGFARAILRKAQE